MRNLFFVGAMTLALSLSAVAQGLNGRTIEVTNDQVKTVHVPLSIAVDSPDLTSVVTVVDVESGAVSPATVRNGELVFIVESLDPGVTRSYTVKVADKPATHVPRVQIKKQEGEAKIDVLIDGAHFTTYHYSNTWKKPFLWPVLSEGGVGLTRDFPALDREDEGMKDHPHHKSWWTAYGEVKLVKDEAADVTDCWGEGDNSGFQTSGEVTYGSGDAYGWIRAKNIWETKTHEDIVVEEREYRFYATPAAGRLTDVKVRFDPKYGAVKFKDTKEGGLVSVRMRPELCKDNAHITNAFGDEGESNCWGKPSPWCDYSGPLKDVGWRGLTIFDNPGNLRHPTSWHVRGYGLMGANAFGYSYFTGKDYNKGLMPDNGDYVIEKDAPLVMNYRVYVHTGNVKKAAVALRYSDYAKPPKVAWKK
jgi:hypothetical protein